MIPLTRERERVLNTFKHKVRALRDCDSPSRLHKFQKIWIRLHVPSRPPFIWRWRDFYIPKTPSSSENIPSVNAYKNVFFT
jgi:hypothetical protein